MMIQPVQDSHTYIAIRYVIINSLTRKAIKL